MLTHSTTGLVHLASAFVAVASGTYVLFATKGTVFHKRWGYLYSASMLVLNGTALSIYQLFGHWGPFHYAALLSLTALFSGFIPALFRKSGWKRAHVSGMYYSVMGLYAALVSEIFTRIPGLKFWYMVGVATGLVMVVGVVLFFRKRREWIK